MRCLQPFDMDLLIDFVKSTNRVLIVEEDNLTAGWGAEVAARLSEEVFYYLDAPIKRICRTRYTCPNRTSPRAGVFTIHHKDRCRSPAAAGSQLIFDLLNQQYRKGYRDGPFPGLKPTAINPSLLASLLGYEAVDVLYSKNEPS